MKMTKETVMELWALLKMLKESKEKIPLGTACNIGKNFRVLNGEIEVIKEVQKRSIDSYPPEINEFEKKRIELCREYADKDDKGEAITENIITAQGIPTKQFKLVERRVEFNEAFAKLREPYEEVFKKKDEIDKEFMDFLATEVEIELMKIKADGLKSVGFTIDEATILEPILDE